MNSGFQFFDIVLLALVAAFIILRLRSVLGRRDGFRGRPRDPLDPGRYTTNDNDRVVPLPKRDNGPVVDIPPAEADEAAEAEAQDSVDMSPLGVGLAQIHRADPSFNTEDFMVGARTAFEMVLAAYHRNDTEALRPLLSDDVFGDFAQAIGAREKAGESLEASLVGIKTADFVEAFMDGRVANVTIKFVSDQVNVTRDAEGRIIDGDPNTVTTVTDFWTFARDTRSRDPNWILVATGTQD